MRWRDKLLHDGRRVDWLNELLNHWLNVDLLDPLDLYSLDLDPLNRLHDPLTNHLALNEGTAYDNALSESVRR